MASEQFTYSDGTSNDKVKSNQDKKESITLVEDDESDADTLSLASFATQIFSYGKNLSVGDQSGLCREMEDCVSDHINDQGVDGKRETSNNSKYRTTENIPPIKQSSTENAQELSKKINSENVGFSGTEHLSKSETTYTNVDCVCKTMERSLSGRVSETKESKKTNAIKTQEIGEKKEVNKLAAPGKCISNDSIHTIFKKYLLLNENSSKSETTYTNVERSLSGRVSETKESKKPDAINTQEIGEKKEVNKPATPGKCISNDFVHKTFEKYLLMNKSLLEKNSPKLSNTRPSEMERLSKIKTLSQFKPLYKKTEWVTEQSNVNKNWVTEQSSDENKDWVTEEPKENTNWMTEQSDKKKDWVTEQSKENNDWVTESPMTFIKNISVKNNNNCGTLQSKLSRYLSSEKGDDMLNVSETLKSKLSRDLGSKKGDDNVCKPGKLNILRSIQETLENNILNKLSLLKRSPGLAEIRSSEIERYLMIDNSALGLPNFKMPGEMKLSRKLSRSSIPYNNKFIPNPTELDVIKRCRSTLEESTLIKELQNGITLLSKKSFHKEVDSSIVW
eukprot:CAMPEP_0194347564 /NCGR_PEP_ID=MMETSP0171-20130528/106060_1 /TAXON_ID=218684 /ORGANISM="Corethron pennatum, Strain L29A3" /LENGTH=561 /DNA_ID=CAMNT_0039114831 /DNA_START=284 /DNA_END=1966 /DNA_ORIENTATION=-